MAPRTLAFCALLLAAVSARAATSSKNPCALDPKPTTAVDIQAAFPPNDAAWSNFLMDRRPQILQQNGEWMEYKYGGYVTARAKSIEDAFVAFCEAKARAATAAKTPRPAAAPPAPAAPPPSVQARAAEAKAKDDGLLKKASAFFSGAVPEAPAEPTAVSSCDKNLCSQAATCRDAGIDGSGNMPTDWKCRRAFSATKGSCCE